jgi:hypothetical protein
MTRGFTQSFKGLSLTRSCLLLLIFCCMSGAINMAKAQTLAYVTNFPLGCNRGLGDGQLVTCFTR